MGWLVKGVCRGDEAHTVQTNGIANAAFFTGGNSVSWVNGSTVVTEYWVPAVANPNTWRLFQGTVGGSSRLVSIPLPAYASCTSGRMENDMSTVSWGVVLAVVSVLAYVLARRVAS